MFIFFQMCRHDFFFFVYNEHDTYEADMGNIY